MRIRLARLLVLVLAVLGASRTASYGQSTNATVGGQITDQVGRSVPGAMVVLTNLKTNGRYTTHTNDQGTYSLPNLPPGIYRENITKDGFKSMVKGDIELHVQDNASINFQLEVGSVSQSITVEGGAPVINTESGAVSTVVDREFVENIPLNGRSFQSLITLTPGVVLVPNTSVNNGLSNGQLSVNGQRAGSNGFTVDGVSANFGAAPGNFGNLNSSGNLPALTTFGTTQSLVSVDALQEFRVLTSTYSAEYGRQPGGQISIITRSGTNQFHGSFFDYLRNDVLDANDWFANRAGQPKAKERQNDFGGTFSGPILFPRFRGGGRQLGYNGRDRTFFFFSYEGLRLRLPQFNLTNVPTLCLRGQGDCSVGQSAAPAGMQPILNAFPLPKGRDLGNGLAEFSAAYSDPSSLNAVSIRIDHTVNSRLTLFGRYNRAPSESVTRQANLNLSVLAPSRLNSETVTLSATASLTPRATSELRVNYSNNGAYQSLVSDHFGGALPPPTSALIPDQYYSSSARGVVTLFFTGRTSTAAPFVAIAGSLVASQRQLNIIGNVSYHIGPHQLKYGVDYRRLTPTVAINSYILSTTFSSQQQVQAATAGTGSVGTSMAMRPIVGNLSAFAQDTWRLTRRLTLDLGVRWDVNPAPSEANGNNPVAVTQIADLATMQLAPLGTREWKTTYNNFAPRLGLAYHLGHRALGETVIRGGFGVFYDTGNDQGLENFNQGFPYASSQPVSNIRYPPSATEVAPAPFPVETGLTPPYGTIFAFDPALKLPYTLQWNVAAEQSVGKNQMITITYVGAAGRRLLQETQLTLNTINPSFTRIFLTRNSATSDYDALQAQFQRRLSRGLEALISYAWSHALDDDSGSLTGRVAERGNAAFDIRHVFAAAATYDIPSRGKGWAKRAILSHWSIDTSLHAQAALPVDLVATTLTDAATGSLVNVRPNVIPGVPFYLIDPAVPGGRLINNTVPTATQIAAAGCAPLSATTPAAGAFCTAPTSQAGNFGRNQVRGLSAWQIDIAARRDFKLTEKWNVQLRAEAFNAFNHPNFGTIQTSLTAANFGQPVNMLNRQLGGLSQLYQIGGPRSFQVSLKLTF